MIEVRCMIKTSILKRRNMLLGIAKLSAYTSSIFLSANISGFLRVGVAKSKSIAVSPRDVKSGIFEGDLDGARPTFQHFTSLGAPPSSHSYKLRAKLSTV